jgi:tetratricopeptide (TPR) repeat protein
MVRIAELEKQLGQALSFRSHLAGKRPMKSKQSSYMMPKLEDQDKSHFLDAIAAHLFTLLKIIIFALLLIAIFFIFIKIYTQQGIAILPFEIQNENLSGKAVVDQITFELLQIQKIHSAKSNAKNLSNDRIIFEARLSTDLSQSDLSKIIPKTEIMDFSMADTGTISTGYGSLDPGKLIIAFKNICPASKPDTAIRGSLQRYGSNIVLIAVLESDEVQSWMVRQPVDNNNEEQLHEMIRNLTFMIARELPQSHVSAKTWEGLKYYTEALDAYNQYELTGDLNAIHRACNYSLKAISSEKGYSKPYGLLRRLEFEYIAIKEESNALEICNRTIELDPSSEYGWQNKANVLDLLNHPYDAIQAYDNATNLNPQYAEAWNDKGSALREIKYYKEAIAAHEEAIRIDPNYANAWNNKGRALKEQGNYADAIKAYDAAIKISPQYANAWNNKGMALRSLNKSKEAVDAFDRATTINPNHEAAWYNLGLVLYDQSKYDEAIAAYEKSIRIYPKDSHAWNNKGSAFQAQGNYEEAIKAFDEAIRIDPKYINAWINKGHALKSLDRTLEADAAFAKARELGYPG